MKKSLVKDDLKQKDKIVYKVNIGTKIFGYLLTIFFGFFFFWAVRDIFSHKLSLFYGLFLATFLFLVMNVCYRITLPEIIFDNKNKQIAFKRIVGFTIFKKQNIQNWQIFKTVDRRGWHYYIRIINKDNKYFIYPLEMIPNMEKRKKLFIDIFGKQTYLGLSTKAFLKDYFWFLWL